MSHIPSKDSKAKLIARRMLHARGLRFRKHVKDMPGKPILVFSRARVVVFTERDFFHGWNFAEWKHKSAPYWLQKIESNRARDFAQTAQIETEGWYVVRVGDHEARKTLLPALIALRLLCARKPNLLASCQLVRSNKTLKISSMLEDIQLHKLATKAKYGNTS